MSLTGSENPTLDPSTCGLSYIVSTALDYGVDNKMIKTNVAKKVILPKEPKRKRIDVWDLEQANQFLETSKEDEQNRYHLAYAIAIICGMRQGEILGLTWKDVDLEENLLFLLNKHCLMTVRKFSMILRLKKVDEQLNLVNH